MSRTYDLTQGKVSSLILKFFFPMLLTNMLQQIYSIADTAIVGKGLGDDALAAVGNMSSLTFLVIGFSMGLANGFSVSIAQSYGAKDYERMRRATAAAVKLSVIISVLLTAVSVSLLKTVLILLQTETKIIGDSLTYGYFIFGGLAATIAYNLCSCILRALGDSKTPFIAIIISTVVNIVLDSLCIFVFKTGVEGAAIATIFAQLLSAFICYLRLRKIDILRLSEKDFAESSSMYREMFGNGLPMALMNSITAVGSMVVQYFVNGLGVAYTTAYAPCSRYITLFIQPACTAGFTMSSYTSQNFGAKRYDRIRQGLHVCLAIALISYILFDSLLILFPRMLAGLMINGETSISLAAQFLPICGVSMIFVDFLFIFRSGCQGMGRPLIPMISGIVEMVMRISVIVLLIPKLGFRATALAEVSAWVGALALNLTAFEIILRKYLRGKSEKTVTLRVKNKKAHQVH